MQRFTLRMPILRSLSLALALAAADSSSAQDTPFTRAQFAAEDTLPSGRFVGVREIIRVPEQVTPQDLDRMRDAYAKQLRLDIENGRHHLELATSRRLIERYGSDQYARLKGAPGFRVLLDQYIAGKADWYLEAELTPRFINLVRRESYALLLDESGNARIDKDVLFATEDGQQDATYNLSNSMTMTITDDQVMQRLRTHEPQALVFNGLFGDPSAYDKWLCGFDPRSAGRPSIIEDKRWTASDIRSTVQHATPQGLATEFRFFRAGQTSEVLVLTLLNDRDYLVYEQREYAAGRRASTITFSDYRRLTDGRWYPFRRASEVVRTAAVDLEPLRTADGTEPLPWSDAALAAADAADVNFSVRDSFTTSVAEPDPKLEEGYLTIDLEPGTTIYDTRKVDRQGQPLRTVTSSLPKPAAIPERNPHPIEGMAMIPASANDPPRRAVVTPPVAAEQEELSTGSGMGWWLGGGAVLIAAMVLRRRMTHA